MLLSLTGARSTLCGVPVAAFICVVIMAAGQLFENLPVAVLAAMIMTAVKNLLMQVRDRTHVLAFPSNCKTHWRG